MKTYYQVYRNGYFYTATLDKGEAFRMAEQLRATGNDADVRIEGRTIHATLTCCLRCGTESYSTPIPRPSGIPGTIFEKCQCGGQVVSNPRRG